MTESKKVDSILPSPATHWVGDGFPVRSVFSPQSTRHRFSPYILMDYVAPTEFEPSDKPRGVDTHPHRGFETVTVVFQGELEHRDSAGNSGSIGAGDVQWMTAASGVLHEEKHSLEFTRQGGTLEMTQIWVNLPAAHKMSPPRYQELLGSTIPTVELAGDAGTVRVIAGTFQGTAGAAQTFSPVHLWDVHLRAGVEARLPVPEGEPVAAFLRSGSIQLGGEKSAKAHELILFQSAGSEIVLRPETDTDLLLLGGEPIDEPLVTYGPFVMNTAEEIQTAIRDFQSGKFGELG